MRLSRRASANRRPHQTSGSKWQAANLRVRDSIDAVGARLDRPTRHGGIVCAGQLKPRSRNSGPETTSHLLAEQTNERAFESNTNQQDGTAMEH